MILSLFSCMISTKYAVCAQSRPWNHARIEYFRRYASRVLIIWLYKHKIIILDSWCEDNNTLSTLIIRIKYENVHDSCIVSCMHVWCVSFSVSILPFYVDLYIYIHMMNKMRGNPHSYVVEDARLAGAMCPKMNLPPQPRMTAMATAATDVLVTIIYIFIYIMLVT